MGKSEKAESSSFLQHILESNEIREQEHGSNLWNDDPEGVEIDVEFDPDEDVTLDMPENDDIKHEAEAEKHPWEGKEPITRVKGHNRPRVEPEERKLTRAKSSESGESDADALYDQAMGESALGIENESMTLPHETVLIYPDPGELIDDSVDVLHSAAFRKIFEDKQVVLKPLKIPEGLKPYITDGDSDPKKVDDS